MPATAMLIPHELATLMLVKDAPERMDAVREEVGLLRALELIALEQRCGPDDASRDPDGLPRARSVCVIRTACVMRRLSRN